VRWWPCSKTETRYPEAAGALGEHQDGLTLGASAKAAERARFQGGASCRYRASVECALRKGIPELDQAGLENARLKVSNGLKEQDPLAGFAGTTFSGKGKEGGQLHLMKLAPNFEMANVSGASDRLLHRHRQCFPLE